MIKLIVVLVLIVLVAPILKNFVSDYDKCYSEKEDDGIAVFECCHGMIDRTEMCIDCPYYVKKS